jgi:glutathione S-transferase
VDTPAIYVASPLGFTEPGRRYLTEVLHPALVRAGVEVLDPWASAIELDTSSLRTLAVGNRAIGAKNATMIARADGLLAMLDGYDVDSGTASEIGYAAGLGLPVVGLRNDLRTSGENEAAKVNLQVQYFIEATGGQIHSSLDAAAAEIATIVDDRFLFHLARVEHWVAAHSSGAYTRSTRDETLDEVGFIHFSFARQLTETARRHYSDLAAEDLVLLTVDRRRVSARVIVEPAASLDERFPHLYGPLNLDAVVAAQRLERNVDGDLTPVES